MNYIIYRYIKLLVFTTMFSVTEVLGQTKVSDNFILKGNINLTDNNYVYLSYPEISGNSLIDSTIVSDGIFSFHGKIDHPTSAIIFLKSKARCSNQIYIEPGIMKIKISVEDFDKLALIGSITQDLNETLNKKKAIVQARYQKQIDSLEIITDSLQRHEIRNRLAPFLNEWKNIDLQFIHSNPQSIISAELLNIYKAEISFDSLKILYHKLGKGVQRTPNAKKIFEFMLSMQKTKNGNVAPSFSSINMDGKKVSLLNYEGKYVLLDFWASWCIPCRKANSNLRKLFLKYNILGIDFISISEDDSKVNWKKAVLEDKISIWQNVLNKDINDGGSISNKYGVKLLPQTILVDPKGIILDRFNWDDDKRLELVLEKIFMN